MIDIVTLTSSPVRLTREVRLCLAPPQADPEEGSIRRSAGSPGAVKHRIEPVIPLRATLIGHRDPHTGWICDIKEIDRIVLQAAEDVIEHDVARWPKAEANSPLFLLPAIATRCQSRLANHPTGDAALCGLEWVTSSQLSYQWIQHQQKADAMIRVTCQFEFSAAHRLHSPQLSDEQNAATFGKCNNPAGHGHNYVVTVTLASTTDPAADALNIDDFRQVVDREVISHFDHRHLDLDCDDFRDRPSTVENLTAVIFHRLLGKFASADLHAVRVYETPKTWAELSQTDYDAGDP